MLSFCGLLLLAALFPHALWAQDIARLQSGVVRIIAKPPSGTPNADTGFIVRLESNAVYIVAAAHVASGEAHPKVEFFTNRNMPVTAEVLGLEGDDEVRGLALVVVRGQENLPEGITGQESTGSAPAAAEPALPPASAAKPDLRQVTQDREITGKDGAPMLLIPEGEFWMGSPDGEGNKNEHPWHTVALSAFYLDTYEVTNRLFQQFVQQTNHRTTSEQEGKSWVLTAAGEPEEVRGAHWRNPEGGETVLDSHREEHPVVSVSWEDAHAYCRWAGKRLPTEAEFEYATRAGTETKYWWGNGNPSSRQVANLGDESIKRQYSNWTFMTGYDDGYVRTAPVGSFEANPFGLHDMTGNVWEWTTDRYDEQYYGASPRKNPRGPSDGDFRVLRGGSWFSAPAHVRSAARFWSIPTYRYSPLGFRCAQDSPK
jgi:formylglycine-generating enzyme